MPLGKVNPENGAGPEVPEITPAMTEAGELVLLDWCASPDSAVIVDAVYRAMWRSAY